MKKAKLLIILSFLVANCTFANTNIKNGEELYKKSKCSNCHGTDIYTSSDRKVTNLKELSAQVNRCNANTSQNWFDDEIDDVIAYLDDSFYKFTKKK